MVVWFSLTRCSSTSSSLNKQWASVTTAELSQHHLPFSKMQHTVPSSARSSLTDEQHGLICSVSSLARDGCLGSGFSLRHNMAKQTDCSEISPDAEMYIIEKALMGSYATTLICTRPGPHLSCQAEWRSVGVSDWTRFESHREPVSCYPGLLLLTGSRWKTSTTAWIPIWLWQLIVELLWLL